MGFFYWLLAVFYGGKKNFPAFHLFQPKSIKTDQYY